MNRETLMRQLVSSPQGRELIVMADEICAKLKNDSSVRETEWDTLKELLTSEGKVRGIKLLIQEMNLQAQNAK